MANFTPEEQLMLELINRARMDPNREAARYGIAINEGPPSKTISSAPKEVLAGNDKLAAAADNHTQWMLGNDKLDHFETPGSPGFTGNSPGDRMTAAGYTPLSYSENAGYRGASSDLAKSASDLHRDLFVDSGDAERGHRVNMMSTSVREIGIGLDTGNFKGSNVAMVTQDFGVTSADSIHVSLFITGVVYNDTTKNDDFFTVGEEQAGIGVAGSGASDSTGAGGGYELEYTSLGTKTITFDLPTGDLTVDVVFGTTNIKLDAVNGREIWTNAKSLTSQSLAITELHALGMSKVKLNGSDANEKIYGNNGNNRLVGNGGKDTIWGDDGRDTIIGGAGKDVMWAGGGADKFVFTTVTDSPAATPDKIKDFGQTGADKINLSALGDLTYRDEAAITGANEVNVTQRGSDVIVHINLNADLGDDMRIVLKDTSLDAMTSGDFIL
jgi:Ca2+-binding RTX toxin-like protein